MKRQVVTCLLAILGLADQETTTMKTISIAVLALAAAAFAVAPNSGLKSGERVVPFHPKHVVGALADTTNCFPCTFQNRPQAQVWVNGDKFENVLALAKSLDKAQVTYKDSEFKSLIVFIVPADKQAEFGAKLKETAKADSLKHVSMAMVAPDHKAIESYKINMAGDVKNTVVLYKNWEVVTNIVNLKGDKAGLATLDKEVAKINAN